MKRQGTKKTAEFKRDAPDLPGEFESGEDSFTDGEFVTIRERHLQDVQAENCKVAAMQVEGALLERVQLAGGQFGSMIWKDVRFIGCDLQNVRAHRTVLLRVELIDCRLTGFHASAADWQEVLIRNGDARYAQLQGGTFRNCEFDGSNWQDADLQNADLSGCVFRGCQLARAELYGVKMQDTDLRKSDVENMLVGVNDLRGAVVDPAQAMVFAKLMGLQIR